MIEIRMLQKTDLDEILELEEICFPEDPWSRLSFEQEVENSISVFLVARDDQNHKLIAYGGLWLMHDVADITNIAVHPRYRREGIGGELLRLLIKVAKEKDMTSITLEVRESNVPAQKMYEAFGFTRCGLRKRYYQGKEDALIMTLELSSLEDK